MDHSRSSNAQRLASSRLAIRPRLAQGRDEQAKAEMSPAEWANLGFTDQLRHSLHTQPCVKIIQVRVGHSPIDRQALTASLTKIFQTGAPPTLRLIGSKGQEEAFPTSIDAAFLMEAILDRGLRLNWTFDAHVDESVGHIAKLVYATAQHCLHGAYTWKRDQAGRLAATVFRPAPAVLSKSSAVIPLDANWMPLGCMVEIFAPATVVRRPVAAILLPPLPIVGAGITDVHQLCALSLMSRVQAGGTLEESESAWLWQYAVLKDGVEAERIRFAAEQEQSNRAKHEREKAQTSNHERRIARLVELKELLAAGTASDKERKSITTLSTAIARDAQHQSRIDRQLSQAVDARAELVTQARNRVATGECTTAAPPIETAKGAFLVYPKGFDPRRRSAIAAWMVSGFQIRRSKVTEPVVDFQISCSHASGLDREWMAYVIRRISWACGRDPDRDVLAATHEPDRHAPSKVDGEPIHVHAHVTFRVCDDAGRTWRCANMHLLIQRELESINRERGWGLTTSAVAKGRQAFWYSAKGSKRIGWSIDGEFTETDSENATRAVADEQVPSDPQRRPGSGIIVVNAQHTARRKALRRADARLLAASGKRVVDLMKRLSESGVSLPTDKRGLVTLDYYSGSARERASSPIQKLLAQLSQAVLTRDRVAIGILCARIDYYAQNRS